MLVLATLVWAFSRVLPEAVDWTWVFRPASLALLAGKSPFSVEGFFNAPWTAILLMPLAVLPDRIGRAALLVVSLISLAVVGRKLGGNKITIALLLLSPPALHGLLNGNIDWLAVYGFVLPPQIGLFFAAIKPQIGVAVGVFWLWQAWSMGGWREALRVFSPFLIVTLLSFLVFGLWPLRFEREVSLWWNASFWPASLPVGLALLVASMRKDKIEFAIGASPCFSPYVLFHSWIVGLFAIIRNTPESIAAFVGLWALVALRFIQL